MGCSITTEGFGRGFVSSVGILTGGGAWAGKGCLGGPTSWGLGALGFAGAGTGTGAGAGTGTSTGAGVGAGGGGCTGAGTCGGIC